MKLDSNFPSKLMSFINEMCTRLSCASENVYENIFSHSTSENIVGGNFARIFSRCLHSHPYRRAPGEFVQLEVRKCLYTNAVEDGNVRWTKENFERERTCSMLQQVFIE